MESLVRELRRSGCVFAEEEAEILDEAAHDAGHLEEMLRRRIAGDPLEHVVGWVTFRGRRLRVGPGVFVPRQRTVHLVDRALESARRRQAPVLVEAFAGVAPIAACLQAELPGAEVHAIEADERALAHARENLTSRRVHAGDVLHGLPARLRRRVDVIVAVPPYVPDGDSAMLPREAREHEPRAALFGGPDGLELVRELVDQAGRWLSHDGSVLLEMHRRQAQRILEEVSDAGWCVIVHEVEDVQTVVLGLGAPQEAGDRTSGHEAGRR